MTEIEETRIMGLDFGKVRIGIALSDPLKTFSYAFKTLSNNQSLINELEKIIKEKSVIKIVLGIPAENKKQSTSVVADVMKFKETLEDKFKVEVILWDETFTSVIAANRVLESVNSKKKRRDKSLLDMNAASVILQEYLDSVKEYN